MASGLRATLQLGRQKGVDVDTSEKMRLSVLRRKKAIDVEKAGNLSFMTEDYRETVFVVRNADFTT